MQVTITLENDQRDNLQQNTDHIYEAIRLYIDDAKEHQQDIILKETIAKNAAIKDYTFALSQKYGSHHS